jgi:predicted flap endonuclease-1-like 5' DNA nuclease
MFSNMNPLSQPTALFEILIMLAGAFILGYLVHCFCGCRRCKSGCCGTDTCGKDCACDKHAKVAPKAQSVMSAVPAGAPVAKAATTMPAAHIVSHTTKDDLKKIEGIGPAIEKLLHAEGITTFAQVASEPASKIKAILEKAGSQFAMHDCSSWAEQAALARDGKWAEFEALLAKLINGKRV